MNNIQRLPTGNSPTVGITLPEYVCKLVGINQNGDKVWCRRFQESSSTKQPEKLYASVLILCMAQPKNRCTIVGIKALKKWS